MKTFIDYIKTKEGYTTDIEEDIIDKFLDLGTKLEKKYNLSKGDLETIIKEMVSGGLFK